MIKGLNLLKIIIVTRRVTFPGSLKTVSSQQIFLEDKIIQDYKYNLKLVLP